VQKNSAAGRNNLGYMYLHGQGVKRDIAQALALFTKAAAQGLPDAQHNLGELYFAGQGTPRDYRKAMHYFSLAAQVMI
jgi:TPR repeat protein